MYMVHGMYSEKYISVMCTCILVLFGDAVAILNSIVSTWVCTAHGKPGKSWNLLFQFPGLESHGI